MKAGLFLKFSPLYLILLFVIHPFAHVEGTNQTGRAESNRPNILFILTDDQRWDSMGCYGNTSIRTPHFDKLAEEGARFDSYYVASPLCCPSRAVFLTGLYPHQTGVTANNRKLPDSIPTVADLLNEAGYVTGFIGKAHLGGNPREWGFKETPVYFPLGSVEARPNRRGNQEEYIVVNGEKKKFEGNITEIFSDGAIAFLEKHKATRWFLWLATTAPHEPFVNYPQHSYETTDIQAPPGWPATQPFRTKGDIVAYYSTISMLDEQIGRVLKKLKELGLSENTFVLFTSDNGYMLGSHGKAAKNVWFEESIRVPALARWPGQIKPMTEVKSFVSSVDFLPTLMDLAGVAKKVSGTAGVSMIPLAKGNSFPVGETFSEVELSTKRYRFWQMIRTGEFKYVKFNDGEEHLYNLKEDPSEWNDLIKSEVSSSIKKGLIDKLQAWIEKTPVIAVSDQKEKNKGGKHEPAADSD